MEISAALAAARPYHQSTLTTLRRNGRPQLSNVLHTVDDEGVVRVSIGVELTNATGDAVAEMTVRWHVRANAES